MQPQWSSEPAGGVMMPAHVAPAPPRLAINLSPGAATRALSMLGLGVALSATVATTLAVIGIARRLAVGNAGGDRPAHELARVGALAVRGRRPGRVVARRAVVRPEAGPAWATWPSPLPPAPPCRWSAAIGSTWTLVTRAGLIVVATVSLSLAFRQFLAGPSSAVRAHRRRRVRRVARRARSVRDARPLHRRCRRDAVAPIDALLSGADALVGLVVATITIRATLVYVRDFLPDFNIALETAADTPEPDLAAARCRCPRTAAMRHAGRRVGKGNGGLGRRDALSGTGIPFALQVAGAGKPPLRLFRREERRRTRVRRDVRRSPARLAWLR